ncbi:MAG: polyprenyl synthetase family protein, partial [Planctomycetota bacterium]
MIEKTLRLPQENIPKTKRQRDEILRIVTDYVRRNRPTGPLSLDELKSHSAAVIEQSRVNQKYRDFIAVLINNEMWRGTVVAVPYEKRLLLLPKCLRDNESCPADFDQLGLICEHCGNCHISNLQTQAEELGYAVLIAEGSPVVMSLIQTKKIEAVIGVSCLGALEQTFPYMEASAIPGIAIPLLYDGCVDTAVDLDWVLDAIYENSLDTTNRLDLELLRQQIDSWFTENSLKSLLFNEKKQTEKLAVDWLAKAGKRWRPFLAVCTYKALFGNTDDLLPDTLRRVTVAVECFHKASLIHDDIEDGDTIRYGQKTMHAEHGVPIALNAGDFLLGEGYRLITELDVPDDMKIKMLQVTAQGHRDLCIGQGGELSWARTPRPLSVNEIIEVFRMKTSPAFEVSLKLGALLAGCGDELMDILKQYSTALGIAYQIIDDIDDYLLPESEESDEFQLSLLFAIAYEHTTDKDKKLLESIRTGQVQLKDVAAQIEKIFQDQNIIQKAQNLAESYKARAIASLARLENASLKGLLRRVLCKIFNEIELMGCCD